MGFEAAHGHAGANGGMSKEEIDRQVEQLDADIERISGERELAQGSFNMYKAEVQRLQDAVGEARQRVGKLALDEEKLNERKVRLGEVEGRITALTGEFDSLKESKAPSEDRLKQRKLDLARMQWEQEKDDKKLGGEVRDMNKDLATVQSLERDIYPFISNNKEKVRRPETLTSARP